MSWPKARTEHGKISCGVQVAESGLDFVIVRAAKSEGVDPSLQETGVSVTPQGSLSKDAKVTKSQVAFCHKSALHAYKWCKLLALRHFASKSSKCHYTRFATSAEHSAHSTAERSIAGHSKNQAHPQQRTPFSEAQRTQHSTGEHGTAQTDPACLWSKQDKG